MYARVHRKCQRPGESLSRRSPRRGNTNFPAFTSVDISEIWNLPESADQRHSRGMSRVACAQGGVLYKVAAPAGRVQIRESMEILLVGDARSAIKRGMTSGRVSIECTLDSFPVDFFLTQSKSGRATFTDDTLYHASDRVC